MGWLYGPEGWDASFRSTFIQWGAPDNRVLGYPKLSQEMLEQSAPSYVFRRVVGTVADFTRGNADYILFNRLKNAYTERWSVLNEFDEVPDIRLGWSRASIGVNQRGIAIKMTEQEQIFARENVESIVRTYLSRLVAGSIEKDILDNALLWIDIVFTKNTTGLNKHYGVAIGDRESRQTPGVVSKTFFTQAGAPHTVDVDIGYDTLFPAPSSEIKITDLLEVKTEFVRRRMKAHTNYVIINPRAFATIFQDTQFQQLIAFSRPERMERAELGEIFGFTFVLDESGELDNVLNILNNTGYYDPVSGTKSPVPDDRKYGSIAIFVAFDGVREAVVLPETVRTDVPVSLGRFTRIGAISYRGEQPLWFYSDDNSYAGLPEDRRISAGIILLGK